jgi:hypothetical protein
MNDINLVKLFVTFRQQYRTSLDKMLADPDLRQPFLQIARQTIGPIAEKQILGRLINLRKNRSLPRAAS